MKNLIALLVLAGCFAGLNALTCHSCTGGSSGDCNDEFTANYSTSCSSSQDACLKTVVTISGSVTSITRACTTDSFCNTACASLFSIETCTNCCTTDDCNGAGALTSSLAALLMTSAVGAYLAHF